MGRSGDCSEHGPVHRFKDWHRKCWTHEAPPTTFRRMHTPSAETLARVEVLSDLEPVVHELMVQHEAKRILWFPSELLSPAPDTDPDAHIRELRERADGISLPARVALALNLLTEE